ncbi:hypothetical protein [Nocardioides sp.]|uniref:hypothetical protein n=1 Tax=Nocardioides sp. TaxID=35761 RepID=UPI0039E26652
MSKDTYRIVNPETGVEVWAVAVKTGSTAGQNVMADLWARVESHRDGRPGQRGGYPESWFVRATDETTPANATLKFNSHRARRMPEAEALAKLAELGFERGQVIRRTVHRDRQETVVTEYHRTSAHGDGSPRYDRARLTVRFAI